MLPEDGQTWWWYYGVTGEQVGQYLTQNNAMLTDIDAYIDSDNSLKFIVTMAPATGTWWWWWGQTAAQVVNLLNQNHARLTKVSPYTDPSDNTLKFAVIMTPLAGAESSSWDYGLTGSQLGSLFQNLNAMPTQISAYTDVDGQLLSQNNARLTSASGYLA